MIVKIAWRNLWRQTRRTLLTVLTVALGLALLLISVGLGDGAHRQMIDSAVRLGSGHLIIQQAGYLESSEVGQVLSGPHLAEAEEWVEKNRTRFPIRQRLPRVFASGLASSADGAAGVQIIGIVPVLEQEVSIFHEKIVGGSFFKPEDSNSAVVGEGIARKLEVKLGEKVVLMAQAANSSEIQSQLVRVSGILRTGMDQYDQMLVLIPLKTAQELLQLGESVHQVAVFLDRADPAESLALLGKQDLPNLEILAWSEALLELRDFIRIDDGGNYVFHIFLFILIAFTVMNTLLMSVLERGREFALLDALGLTPSRRFAVMFVEALFVAIFSVAIGFVVGYSGHLYLHAYGLPLDIFYSGEIPVAGVIMDPVMYSELSLKRIFGSLALIVFLILVLSLVPALRAARTGNVHLLGRQ